MVNDDIAQLVVQEMKKTSDLSIVAQNVVENVKSHFYTACRDGQRSGRLDDITLIVRNFGYPTPVPHTHSYPGSFQNASQQNLIHGGVGVGGGGGGGGFMPDHHHHHRQQQQHQSGRVLHTAMSVPSHMHNQQHRIQQYGLPSVGGPSYYPPSGPPHGGHPGSNYHQVSQPHMSLQSSGGGNVALNDAQFYSMGAGGASRTNYSGLQGPDPQNRHPQAMSDVGHHNQGYEHGGIYHHQRQPGVVGAGGGYPPNYQQELNQYHQPVSGQPMPSQHPRPHQPAGYTVSDPHRNIPPHPAYNQRSGSLPHGVTSPEHLKHKYENVPNPGLNTITESEHQSTTPTTSPTKQSGAIYENVKLRQEQQAGLLQKPSSGSGDVQTNRYSDSLLAEKTRDMTLEQPVPGSGSAAASGVPQARPHSAEPPRQVADNENFVNISALPNSQTGLVDQDDVVLSMYGYPDEPGGESGGGGGNSSTMSTLTQGTLSSSELPSMGGISHTPSMPDIEAKTPVNGEVRQLGSVTNKEPPPPPPAKSQSAESAEEEDQGEEEGLFTADVTDFSASEASEAEPDDEIDAESGEIRSYIKNWGNFPFHLSWEEV